MLKGYVYSKTIPEISQEKSGTWSARYTALASGLGLYSPGGNGGGLSPKFGPRGW